MKPAALGAYPTRNACPRQTLPPSLVNQELALCRSHIYYGVQLVQLLVLLAVVSTSRYISSTWGAWLVRLYGFRV